jgi:hypothetical protein
MESRTDKISLGEIVDGLGHAGIGMMLLILSLPALVPIPGPIGFVFGLLVALVAMQLVLGARQIVLPDFARKWRIPASAVRAFAAKGEPILRRVEKWLRPRRLLVLTGQRGRMALGLPIMLMGFAVALPIPTGNVPPVASLIVLSLGLINRDGLAVIFGLILAVVAVGWFALLYFFGAQMWLWVTAWVS